MSLQILSYPRSGSNWLSYCINYICKLPADTPGYKYFANDLFKGMPDYVVEKTHAQSPEYWSELHLHDWAYILLIRNYKECIPRQIQSYQIEHMKSAMNGLNPLELKSDVHIFDYINVLKVFDKSSVSKICVYYEDLIVEPERELKRVVEFLKPYGGEDNLDDFMNCFGYHKEQSLSYYVKSGPNVVSATQGSRDKIIYHSKDMDKGEIMGLDSHVKNKFPILFEKYLRRYEGE